MVVNDTASAEKILTENGYLINVSGREEMSVGELYAVVYHSLAECYRDDIRGLEAIL